MSAPTIRHHRGQSGSRLKPIVASCAPRCNGATVMDRARLFPAADRLPVVPSELRSKGTRREALPGLISGTFLLALSGERRALWSAVALTTSRAIPRHRSTPAVLASPPSSPCSRPPATSRTPRSSRVRRQRRPGPPGHRFALQRLTFSVSKTCLSSQPTVSGRCLTAWSAESSVLPDVAAMNLNRVSRARVPVRLAG